MGKSTINILASQGMTVTKWKGIRNSDTKTITGGYLFVYFDKSVTLFPVYRGSAAKDELYEQGRHIGFTIPQAKNRKDAIEKFRVLHVVVEK